MDYNFRSCTYRCGSMLKRLKCKWKKFIEAIAAQNKTTYGEGGLNCCDLKSATEDRVRHPL